MNIGIIIGSLGFGGAERVSLNLSAEFIRYGHNVTFLTTKKLVQDCYSLPIGAVQVSCYTDNKFQIIKYLRRAIKKADLSAVIVMSTSMCVYAVPALIGTGIPYVVSERSAPGKGNVKKITQILSSILMRFADAYIFQTEGAKSFFPKKVQERGYVIANPLCVESLPAVFSGSRENRVIAVARLVKEKNFTLLIDAFSLFIKEYPDYTLDIYGAGYERERIEGYVLYLGMHNLIHLHGAVADVWQRAGNAGMYVLSSDYEGMPNSLIEAMAMGVPCIATDCPSGGPAALINNGENGLLVNVNDSRGLFIAMCILAENHELSKQISKKSQEIRQRLDVSRIATQWLAIIEEIIARSMDSN